MNLAKMYEAQEKLDKHILEQENWFITNIHDKKDLFEKTKLALLVELGEFANTTRCFKHWSKKEKMADDVILDELADVWHFFLSLGNQMNFRVTIYGDYGYEFNNMTEALNEAFEWVAFLDFKEVTQNKMWYSGIRNTLYAIAWFYQFTSEDVEEAYFKKHKINYERQANGY